METKIIRIGDSKGVIIPKVVLDACQFGSVVEYRITEQGELILSKSKKKPREGWEENLKKMVALYGEEAVDEIFDHPADEEWTWPEQDLQDETEYISEYVEQKKQTE